MNDREIQVLKNVLNDEYGFKLVLCLLKQLGAFERGINRESSDKQVYMTLGKREKGLWLLDCVFKANPEIYMKLLKEKEKENEQ